MNEKERYPKIPNDAKNCDFSFSDKQSLYSKVILGAKWHLQRAFHVQGIDKDARKCICRKCFHRMWEFPSVDKVNK